MAIRHYLEVIPAKDLNLPLIDLTKIIFTAHYIFDDTVGHHLCDIRPAYEMILVGHSWDMVDGLISGNLNEGGFDTICMELSAEDELSKYIYCHSVNLEKTTVLWNAYDDGLPEGFEFPDVVPENTPPWEVYVELATAAKQKIESATIW